MTQTVLVDASPFINVKKPDEKVKNDLYNLPFSYYRVANKFGPRPQKTFGFWESDESFRERLQLWEAAENDVLFEGWECKDMYQFQELVNRKTNTIITIEIQEYEVNYSNRRFLFPVQPETIDDFINDLKRIGITLFWKQKIKQIYGIESITSNTKIIDYYGALKTLTADQEND